MRETNEGRKMMDGRGDFRLLLEVGGLLVPVSIADEKKLFEAIGASRVAGAEDVKYTEDVKDTEDTEEPQRHSGGGPADPGTPRPATPVKRGRGRPRETGIVTDPAEPFESATKKRIINCMKRSPQDSLSVKEVTTRVRRKDARTSNSHVREALEEMESEGLVKNTGYGEYALIEDDGGDVEAVSRIIERKLDDEEEERFITFQEIDSVVTDGTDVWAQLKTMGSPLAARIRKKLGRDVAFAPIENREGEVLFVGEDA